MKEKVRKEYIRTSSDAPSLTPERWHELYVKRKEGKLARIEDCVVATIQGLEEYTKNNKKRMTRVTNNSNNNKINVKTNEINKQKNMTRKIAKLIFYKKKRKLREMTLIW